MKTIRSNCFETNSSSTHSISIIKHELTPSYLTIFEEDNKIHVYPGEFGWEIKTYSDQNDKLEYLISMLFETEGNQCKSRTQLWETEGYQLINDAIKEYCNCDGIFIEGKFGIKSYKYNGEEHFYLEHDGYIDHQSCEDYSSIKDFLNSNGINSVIEFIFNPTVLVHTDNDNH